MLSTPSITATTADWLSSDRVPSSQCQGYPKTQTHRISNETHDHVFVPKAGGMQAYLTGQGQGIKEGDALIVQNGDNSDRYRVSKISYYSNPPNMWVALLRKSAFGV
ncbi:MULTISPECIES: hypothetical protein [unclassified Coleofasciculus]|uniref:hypothetical protein n=1 Tax=unclassified Coleofasciculus TaxID=2692782 RepID=UPI00187E5CD9|nr:MULTISPECIES: hypothetical protein [unclassified Coleofasciculus]MBE9128471.1 hypothetical protein [Coleofasciculus sp. LEGE 07081]MBE9149270.1 hypothetical protein [Coleofasciculus sp. LEGE 07092]